MFRNLHTAHSLLRYSLALVFFWFGIDKFIHPQYWIDAWLPQSVINVLGYIHVATKDFMYLQGIIEVLIGVSFLFNIFVQLFAIVAAVLLVAIMIFSGFGEVMVRDVGLLGGLLALATWPDRRR